MTSINQAEWRTPVAGEGGVGLEEVGVGGAGGAGGQAQLAAGAADALSREAAGLRERRQVADLGAVALHARVPFLEYDPVNDIDKHVKVHNNSQQTGWLLKMGKGYNNSSG